MNKKIFFASIAVMLTVCSVARQKGAAITPEVFKKLVGCWLGTLDYSGTMIRKPFTTTTELVIKQIGKSNKFEFLHIYTKEPTDNVTDTITISKDGRKLNHETIKSKRYTSEGNVEIITEVSGFDRDTNKPVIERYTRLIGKYIYTFKKQVQPEGQTDWLERQEFKYARKPCTK